jgi:hypothetical protein
MAKLKHRYSSGVTRSYYLCFDSPTVDFNNLRHAQFIYNIGRRSFTAFNVIFRTELALLIL